MAIWPNTLPVPSFSGYGIDPVDPVIRTEMETGAARNRRRTRSRNDRVGVTWEFNDAQMAIFRTWFDSDAGAAGGAAWFTAELALGATGLTSYDVRFTGVWKSTLSGGMNWAVIATLEIRQ